MRSSPVLRRLAATRRRAVAVVLALGLAGAALPGVAAAQVDAPSIDGRAGLAPDQAAATANLEHTANVPKPEGLSDYNSDLAFRDGHAIVGNYDGVSIYDLADPDDPQLRTVIACPGGQNDVSTAGDLLFVSVESGGYTGCDDGSASGSVAFRGIRIFDLRDLDAPRQVAAVQTCRGSHTHTLVPHPTRDDVVYVYVSGVISPRGDAEEVGLDCSAAGPDDRADSRWRIDIIEVPLDRPADARLVGGPRLFAEDGRIDGLQQEPPTPVHPSGQPWLPEPVTQSCHDVTAYPELGLAAGACEGNGLLIDITDPVNPVRIAAVADPNFAYWHSATFNDDGTKVVFTDEWGGGLVPHCLPTDRPEWGANAIYDVVRHEDGTASLEFASYYKIPNTQSGAENCVAHNGSLIPVPGRDVMVQAWYQGGLSVWEFTDSDDPVELAWFDRGPAAAAPAGFWSTYWYDGRIYGSEIARGLDVFALQPDEQLSAAELEAAASARGDRSNVQTQTRYGPPRSLGVDASVPCSLVTPTGFRDVGGPPHGANVGCVAGYGIAQGRADGTYGPAQPVRRDQMASFLARMLAVAGVELPADAPDAFTDDDGSTHERAVDRLAAAGVIQGRADGSFGPAGTVTRAQMASFLVRSLELAVERDLAAGGGPFADTEGSVHADAIDVAAMLNVAQGRTATRFDPNGDVRRDQMGSFLARTLRVLAAEGFELTPR